MEVRFQPLALAEADMGRPSHGSPKKTSLTDSPGAFRNFAGFCEHHVKWRGATAALRLHIGITILDMGSFAISWENDTSSQDAATLFREISTLAPSMDVPGVDGPEDTCPGAVMPVELVA